ncbi:MULTISPECIES: hypothetical protein [unclassified Bradyrhizobium]|uniref:hypothetical protein n=1 Tax=unclassified Bradyrhizobium TaxID=2631580 RepID=UPI0028EECC0F|nr:MULTISPECIES: hypothetical protein [unclassified Bradyrhizobium]
MSNEDDENSPGMITFRAFERERQEEFATGVDAIPLDISDLQRAMSQLVHEDIRFIPVIACAFADDELEKMFKQFLPDDIPGGKSSMLGRFGPISSLFARIQFAFAFDMIHSDVLLALDKLRGYRNKIAHTWDQGALPDFVETPLPYMDELESAFLHIDLKDGGDGDLSAEASLRLRTVWLLARLFYESRIYMLAKMAKLNPYRALYGTESPKALHTISSAASIYTQLVFNNQ